MIRRIAFSLLLVSSMAGAIDIGFGWDSDGLDTGGSVIPPEVLSYNLYVETDGGPQTLLVTTLETTYRWENADMGCHKFYVTAYRADSDLESAPSNSVERCVTPDTDVELQILIPRSPRNMRGRWEFAQ